MDFDNNDVAAGALVVGVALLFLAMLLFVNRERLTSNTTPVNIHLTDIAGIEPGVDVIYKGYKAGSADRVSIAYEPTFHFVVRLAVKSEIRLRQGTKVMVRNKGFGGAKLLELMPPADETTAPSVAKDALLPVVSDADLMKQANAVLGRVEEVVKSIQGADPGTQIKATLTQLQGTITGTNRLVGNLNLLLEENRGDIKSTLGQTRRFTEDSSALLTKRRTEIERSLANLDAAMAHLPAILQNVEELTADLKKNPWRLIRKGEPKDAPKLDHAHPAPQ